MSPPRLARRFGAAPFLGRSAYSHEVGSGLNSSDSGGAWRRGWDTALHYLEHDISNS